MRAVTISLAGVVLAISYAANGAGVEDATTGKFLTDLLLGQRDAVKTMIDEPISQMNGTGPDVLNGMYKGLWRWRIIEGKDQISSEAFLDLLGHCRFLNYTDVGPQVGLTGQNFQVVYACDGPVLYHFMVKKSDRPGMVHVSNLGKALNALRAPQQPAQAVP